MESLKKYLSYSYYTLPLIDNFQDQKLIVVTTAGVIMGTPISKDDSDESIHGLYSVATNFANDYREEYSLDPEQRLDGNDGFMPLKDVTLHSGHNTFHFDFLNVFFDQIVAITIGKTN